MASGGKVKLYLQETGEAIEAWPVDAKEILLSGGYAMAPPAEQPPASALGADPAQPVPEPLLIDGMSPKGLAVLAAAGETTDKLLEFETTAEALEAFPALSAEDRAALESWHRVGRERLVRVETKKAAAGASTKKPGRPRKREVK